MWIVKYQILKIRLMVLKDRILLVVELVFKFFKSNIVTGNALKSLTCSQSLLKKASAVSVFGPIQNCNFWEWLFCSSQANSRLFYPTASFQTTSHTQMRVQFYLYSKNQAWIHLWAPPSAHSSALTYSILRQDFQIKSKLLTTGALGPYTDGCMFRICPKDDT